MLSGILEISDIHMLCQRDWTNVDRIEFDSEKKRNIIDRFARGLAFGIRRMF